MVRTGLLGQTEVTRLRVTERNARLARKGYSAEQQAHEQTRMKSTTRRRVRKVCLATAVANHETNESTKPVSQFGRCGADLAARRAPGTRMSLLPSDRGSV